jgi:broad specificity phosphatase PhoE
MRAGRLIAAALLGVALAAPMGAQAKDALAEFEARLRELEPQRWIGRSVNEADVKKFFDWMRASVLAAAQGREAPPLPEELRQKAEALSRELVAQGALTGLALLDALEESARRALREAQQPAPPPPGAI